MVSDKLSYDENFERLVSLFPEKQRDESRLQIGTLINSIATGQIPLEKFRSLVQTISEEEKNRNSLRKLAELGLPELESAASDLDDFMGRGPGPSVDRAAYLAGDQSIIDKVHGAFAVIVQAVCDHQDNIATVEKAYVDSFKFDPLARRLFWREMGKACKDRHWERWSDTFSFIYLVECGDPESVNRVRLSKALIAECTIPPLNSINNYEIAVINESKFSRSASVKVLSYLCGYDREEIQKVQRLTEFREKCKFPEFSERWADSGYARVEVGHKLAAALCLTDIPEPVESPWGHWSLVIPSGIFEVNIEVENSGVRMSSEIERLWCVGCKILGVIYRLSSRTISGLSDGMAEKMSTASDATIIQHFDNMDFGSGGPMIRTIYNNLVRGICLCVTDRKTERKGNWGTPSHHSEKRKKVKLAVTGERYVIGKPVSIDLREELAEMMSGKQRSGSGPKVQFLVRGHFRNQAHGPGRTLHRRQWIEPFWKGNEETRTLLRTYEIKGSDH